MCAFMMPVVKNDWDVYKVDKSRSRNNSESSGVGGGGGRRSRQGVPGPGGARGPRRLSEGARSHSYHVTPSSYHDLQYVNNAANNRGYHSHNTSRHTSQTSFGNFAGDLASPAKSSHSLKKNINGPPKSPSTNSLNKFHNKVMDKLRNALHLNDHNDSDTSQDETPEDTRTQS